MHTLYDLCVRAAADAVANDFPPVCSKIQLLPTELVDRLMQRMLEVFSLNTRMLSYFNGSLISAVFLRGNCDRLPPTFSYRRESSQIEKSPFLSPRLAPPAITFIDTFPSCVSNEWLEGLYFPQLRRLELDSVAIDDHAFTQFISKHTILQQLVIRNASFLTGKVFSDLTENALGRLVSVFFRNTTCHCEGLLRPGVISHLVSLRLTAELPLSKFISAAATAMETHASWALRELRLKLPGTAQDMATFRPIIQHLPALEILSLRLTKHERFSQRRRCAQADLDYSDCIPVLPLLLTLVRYCPRLEFLGTQVNERSTPVWESEVKLFLCWLPASVKYLSLGRYYPKNDRGIVCCQSKEGIEALKAAEYNPPVTNVRWMKLRDLLSSLWQMPAWQMAFPQLTTLSTSIYETDPKASRAIVQLTTLTTLRMKSPYTWKSSFRATCVCPDDISRLTSLHHFTIDAEDYRMTAYSDVPIPQQTVHMISARSRLNGELTRTANLRYVRKLFIRLDVHWIAQLASRLVECSNLEELQLVAFDGIAIVPPYSFTTHSARVELKLPPTLQVLAILCTMQFNEPAILDLCDLLQQTPAIRAVHVKQFEIVTHFGLPDVHIATLRDLEILHLDTLVQHRGIRAVLRQYYMPSLHVLRLTATPSSKMFDELAVAAPNLRCLTLRGTQTVPLSAFHRWKRLQRLHVEASSQLEELPASVEEFYCKIADIQPPQLANLPMLVKLDLSLSGLNDDGLVVLSQHLRNSLEALWVNSCPRIQVQGLQAVLSMPRLVLLSFCDCLGITACAIYDWAVEHPAALCRALNIRILANNSFPSVAKYHPILHAACSRYYATASANLRATIAQLCEQVWEKRLQIGREVGMENIDAKHARNLFAQWVTQTYGRTGMVRQVVFELRNMFVDAALRPAVVPESLGSLRAAAASTDCALFSTNFLGGAELVGLEQPIGGQLKVLQMIREVAAIGKPRLCYSSDVTNNVFQQI